MMLALDRTASTAAPSKRTSAHASRYVTASPNILDDMEIARRLLSLISLLGIYVLGLLLVALVSDGPDIGVLLAAMFGHAVYTSTRWAIREIRERNVVLSTGHSGVLLFSRRARLIRYREIASATATDEGLTLRLRNGGDHVMVRWRDADRTNREAFLDRLFGHVRSAAKRPRAATAASAAAAAASLATQGRSQESLAGLTNALGAVRELARPSSKHLAIAS
jgi:hypothetical protein